MTDKIRILVIEPGKDPRTEYIEDTLEDLQKIVGGYIEIVRPPAHRGDDAVVICNETGKMLGLEPCRVMRFPDGALLDILVGTLVIVRAPVDSDEFAGLTDEQVEKWSALTEF